MNFRDLCEDWKKWSATADKSEDGWQSSYPMWSSLMNAAKSTMSRPSPTPQELESIELCWSISEETEELADFAKEHIDQCWESLCQLTRSEHPDVRWQAYDALGFAGKKSEPFLRKGIEDSDSYVRRRAILSLAKLQPEDARLIAERFIENADPYLRQAALEMAYASRDADFIAKTKNKLLHDSVGHVRNAAARRLE